jgi:hypothetical protein
VCRGIVSLYHQDNNANNNCEFTTHFIHISSFCPYSHSLRDIALTQLMEEETKALKSQITGSR